MGKVFAPGFNRNEQGWILFPTDQAERKGLFFPMEVMKHPAKMNFHLQQAIIEYVAEEGDTILDPFGGCYDTETEVLTKDGWKFFKDVTLEDKIATLNDRFIEYHKPIRLVNKPYKGKMYHVHTTQIDLVVTPDHNMYVAPRKSDKPRVEWEYGLYPAKDIFGKWVNYKKEALWQSPYRNFFPIGRLLFEMDNWLKFFGLWLAEGYTTSTKLGNVGIRNNNQDLLWGEIAPILEKYGVKTQNTSDLSRLAFTNHDLWNYLKPLGKAQDKYIPREYMELPPSQLSILLDYYLMGDGSTYGKQKYAWTSSPKLAGNLQEIALKTGKSANIYQVAKQGDMSYMPSEDRVIIAKHNHYRVNFLQPSLGTRVNSNHYPAEEWIDYNGTIHCVEVPNHIMYIRRNGKPVWCGNTGTLMIAALQGYRVILLEIEDGYYNLEQKAREELDRQVPGAGNLVTLIHNDCRLVLPIPCDHVITSPPYAKAMKITRVRKKREDAPDDWLVQQDQRMLEYSKSPRNISKLNVFMYNMEMEKIYRLCSQSIKPGGTFTIVIKDRIEEGKRLYLSDWVVRICHTFGLELELWEKWKAPGHGFTKIAQSQGKLIVEDEDIMVFRRIK